MPGERRRPLADLLSGREVVLVKPKVLEISERHHDLRLSFAPPGTIALLVASAGGERELQRLVQAIEKENFAELEAVHSELAHRFADFVLAPSWNVDALYKVPVFVSFRYGAKTLRRGMFAHGGLPIAHSLALYDGAALDAKHFTVVEHRARGHKDAVHAVVVVRKPRLTDLERHLIERIPAEVSSEINLGEEYGMWTAVVVGQVVADLGKRVIERVADELTVGDQVRAVEGVITAPAAVVQGIGAEGVRAIEGAVNAGLDVIGLGQAARDVEGAVGHAVDDVVNAIVDAVGDAVAWVTHNIFTADNAQADQGQAQQAADQGQAQQADQGQAQQADQQQADDQQQQQADDQQAQDNAGNDGQDVHQNDEGGRWQDWVDQVERIAKEAEVAGAAVAVRELLALRADMIASSPTRVPPLRGGRQGGGEVG